MRAESTYATGLAYFSTTPAYGRPDNSLGHTEAIMASLGWRRFLSVSILVSGGAGVFLLHTGSVDSELLILLHGMLFCALGLSLGSHFVIRDRVPPSLGRLIGAALTGAFSGALLSLVGLEVGATLSNLLSLRRSEGTEWAVIFLPFWILFSGSFAIFARYLVWKLLGNQPLVAVGAGAVGALVGDSLMMLILVRPFTTGPHLLHAPIVMTAGFGALIASGLAWAERKVPHGNPEATDTSSATDTTEQ